MIVYDEVGHELDRYVVSSYAEALDRLRGPAGARLRVRFEDPNPELSCWLYISAPSDTDESWAAEALRKQKQPKRAPAPLRAGQTVGESPRGGR